jgi:hypothetical protein
VAIHVGYARERSRESVLVYDHFLVDLRNETAEVGSLAIELLGVGDFFGLSSRLGRCGNKRHSLSRSRICRVLNNWFRLSGG